MIPIKAHHPEVVFAQNPIVKVDSEDITALKSLAQENSRRRIRLCAHPHTDDLLHEMLIIHEHGTYIRPHRHPGKSESFHIIEGVADIVIFTDAGEVAEVLPMGTYSSGLAFYYRLNPASFHTLLIKSPLLVFHETTNGPFRRSDLIFAPWAPDEADAESATCFMARLCERIQPLVPAFPGDARLPQN